MKTMIKVMENTAAFLSFLILFVSTVDVEMTERLDIIEKRIGGVETRISIIETRINFDTELAKSLQQNFEELNNSLINIKEQLCSIQHQQTEKEKQTSWAKLVELAKSSRILVSLGLNREKQWTRDQVEKLTGLVNEQTDLLNRSISEFKNKLKGGTEEVEADLDMLNATIDNKIRTLSKLDEIITNNVKDMKEVSAKFEDKFQTELSKLDEIITNNVKDVKEVSAKIDDKFQTKLSKLDKIITNNIKDMNTISLKSDTTEQLIIAQQREIETLKETQAKLLNALSSLKLVNYDYTCPPEWTNNSSYCYLFVNERKTFSEARVHCKRLGATVSDIENEAENDFILSTISSILKRGVYIVWIGISDDKQEGSWISERTAQPASFTKFPTNQPDGGVDENCAANSLGVWFDFSCDDVMLRFICKKDANIDFKL